MALAQKVIDFYVRSVKPHIPNGLRRGLRRVRMAWAYRGALSWPRLSMGEKLSVIGRFIRVDLDVPLGHKPGEILPVCRTLLEREPRGGEVMVEAGCWEGGSTAKFSIICKMMGIPLYVYDSFEGVEKTDQEGWDFTGEYAAPLDRVKQNIAGFGEIDVCTFFKGWFIDTLAAHPVREPVRTVFIDCDLAKGTVETLQGVLPSLSPDGVVYSQDYHIGAVKKVLHDPDTWKSLGRPQPSIRFVHHHLAEMRW
jgi:O-methyltransferase